MVGLTIWLGRTENKSPPCFINPARNKKLINKRGKLKIYFETWSHCMHQESLKEKKIALHSSSCRLDWYDLALSPVVLFRIRNTCFRPARIQPLVEKAVEFKNMNFSKDKYQVLHLEQNSQRAQYTLIPVWLTSCLAEKVGALSGHPAKMSQQYTAAADVNLIVSCIPRGITSRDRDMIIPLFSVYNETQHCEAAPGALCPILVPTTQGRCRQTGESPKEHHEDDQKTGESAV